MSSFLIKACAGRCRSCYPENPVACNIALRENHTYKLGIRFHKGKALGSGRIKSICNKTRNVFLKFEIYYLHAPGNVLRESVIQVCNVDAVCKPRKSFRSRNCFVRRFYQQYKVFNGFLLRASSKRIRRENFKLAAIYNQMDSLNFNFVFQNIVCGGIYWSVVIPLFQKNIKFITGDVARLINSDLFFLVNTARYEDHHQGKEYKHIFCIHFHGRILP